MGLTAMLTIVVCTLVVSLGAASPALAITPDDCAAARAWGYTQTDVEAAHDAALIADGVLEGIPQDSLTVPARVAAVVVWAIPQSIYRGFEHSYNIAQACDDNDHQQLTQDIKTTIDDQADLDLRLKIEENLAEAGTPIALFELPASSGGYIQTVRDIVADVITKMQALNQPMSTMAVKKFGEGNALLAQQKYKSAYHSYAQAYQHAASLK
jgi:hypothetical protein